METEQLKGGVLIIGSLFWETEANAVDKILGKHREEWRDNHLEIDKAVSVSCPIRYGRPSESRFNTFTMLFSNSCPALGKGKVVPFKNTFAIDKEFSSIKEAVSTLAFVEGIRKEEETQSRKSWGMVAIKITEGLKKRLPDVYDSLKKWWAQEFSGDNDRFRIDGSEKHSVTKEGFLNIEVMPANILDSFDFILATPVTPKVSRYPSEATIVNKMQVANPPYFTYFTENRKAGLTTYQDEEILTLADFKPFDLFESTIEPLSFDNYSSGEGGRSQLRKDLIRRLGNALFIPSETAVCFHALNCLAYPYKDKPKYDEAVVKDGCESVLQLFDQKFGIYDDPQVKPGSSMFTKFIFHVLGFEKLPGREMERIENLIKDDLSVRHSMIEYYESKKPIIDYLQEDRIPNNHEDKILLDFYKRNIHELKTIIKYVISGLKNRVLYNCAVSYLTFTDYFSWYHDKPYTTTIPNSFEYFDHRRIDLCGHKLGEVRAREVKRFKNLYDENKAEFYSALQEYVSYEQVFHQVNYYISVLEGTVSHRKDLFDELKSLFENKNWYGFYALGLSQIEGLFSEMASSTDPKKALSSLPDKVEVVRPYYDLSHSSFDYFQYYVPLLRNKFMHTGIDEDLELKCNDVLYDLLYLLRVYTELKSPKVELNQIIKNRKADDFLDIPGYNRYFDLLDKFRPKPDDPLFEEVNRFEKEFISEDTDIESILQELTENLPKAFAHLHNTIKTYTGYNTVTLDLHSLTMHLLTKGEQEYLTLIKPVYDGYTDIFLNLKNYDRFLLGCAKYLPCLIPEIRQAFNNLHTTHADDFKKLNFILNNVNKY